MLTFPPTVDVMIDGKTIRFRINAITQNIFAIEHHMHTMRNMDDVIFGYIIYREGYLYAYCNNVNEDKPHYLIFTCYIGPDDMEMDDVTSTSLFQSIGAAAVQLERYKNKHPAVTDKEAFEDVYKVLMEGIQDTGDKHLSPGFITPLYDMAINLRDFYANMAMQLEDVIVDIARG